MSGSPSRQFPSSQLPRGGCLTPSAAQISRFAPLFPPFPLPPPLVSPLSPSPCISSPPFRPLSPCRPPTAASRSVGASAAVVTTTLLITFCLLNSPSPPSSPTAPCSPIRCSGGSNTPNRLPAAQLALHFPLSASTPPPTPSHPLPVLAQSCSGGSDAADRLRAAQLSLPSLPSPHLDPTPHPLPHARLPTQSGAVVAVTLLIVFGLLNSLFDGKPVAKLPFVPFAFIQRNMSHRNLPGDDPTDCSMVFLYMLCSLSIRPNLQKLLGFAPPHGAAPNMFAGLDAKNK
ncbi:unnamed protein product [Closterium sp. Naga37s-1]|nr:unnamed protein product [Closterium sp. Naga37s-1]